MSEPFSNHSSDSSTDPGQAGSRSTAAASSERLSRWAELIAVGEATLPDDLTPAEIRTVLRDVGRLRRKRMVRLVARAIAQELFGKDERKERV